MDWSNESYVRLYTRDTTTWRRLGWDGQCVLMQLIRKVDRAGVLEIGDLEPWEAAMLHIGCPEDVARRGMDALVRTETVTIRDGRVTFPSFIEAQECVKSDKLRARESRARRAAEGVGPYGVTKRDDMQSQNVTPASREITPRHAPSRAVTPRHSLLCSALPSSALPSGEHARAPDPPDPPDPPAAELEPDEPPPETQTPELVRKRFTAWFAKHRKGTPPTWGPNNAQHLRTLADWLDAMPESDPRKLLERTLAGFFADPKARSKGFPIAYLAQNPAEYLHPPEAERDVRNMGFVPPAPSGTYGKPTSVEELWGKPSLPPVTGAAGGSK